VVAKVRERLAVKKRRFNLKKLNEVEAKEQFRVEVSKKVCSLGRFGR
jgi:hypothetical protein